MKKPILFLFLIVFSCKTIQISSYDRIDKSATYENAVVVSAHNLASDVGVKILKKGGNAVDAAVAVQFALAVVYPRAGNLGGGGFMIIRNPAGKVEALDYREKAPQAATRDMYLDSLNNVIDGLSRYGGLAVGVPGTVDGLITAWKKYGKIKDFEILIQPAIDLASRGFNISKSEARRLNRFKDQFKKYNTAPNPFVKDSKWKQGDILTQKDLAGTLKSIRDNGRAGFYKGQIAKKIVDQVKRSEGIISMEDLANYKAQWRKPIVGNYKNYKIFSMPPPSSGGVALVQMLKMVEKFPVKEWGFQSPETVHLMTEVERRVYADRAKYLGDSDFFGVPVKHLLDEEYLQRRMKNFDKNTATPSDSVAAGNMKVLLESFETTHTSIVDKNKMAVSVTTTLNSNFGSKVIVQGGGFFLNNEMDDFSAKPGVPNQFGLIGAEANAIAPEKRMLSSMTPTIVEKDDELFMVLGTPGGSTIITSVFQVFLNVAEFGMDLEKAVNAKRFHHQWLPDNIFIERGCFDDVTMEKLKNKGHNFKEYKYIGLVKAVQILPDGKLHGVGDIRSDDDVEGY